jgi:hypothetical protein
MRDVLIQVEVDRPRHAAPPAPACCAGPGVGDPPGHAAPRGVKCRYPVATPEWGTP